MTLAARRPGRGPAEDKSLKLQVLHTPAYASQVAETSLLAEETLTPDLKMHSDVLLMGRGASHLAEDPRFSKVSRTLICIDNIEISRKTLAIRWNSERGLAFWRLSDSTGTRVHYRQWGHHSVNELHDRATGLSPRTAIRLGNLGFWVRTVTDGEFEKSDSRGGAERNDPNKTLTQRSLPGLETFQEEFSCKGGWMDASHTLTEECTVPGHNKARANLSWLLGPTLPSTAWPPAGWVLPKETETTIVLSRVQRFDATNVNVTTGKKKPLKVIQEWTMEGHIATVADALQRILEEGWLPHRYILHASQILHEAVPVNWNSRGGPTSAEDLLAPPAHREPARVWRLPPNIVTVNGGTRTQ